MAARERGQARQVAKAGRCRLSRERGGSMHGQRKTIGLTLLQAVLLGSLLAACAQPAPGASGGSGAASKPATGSAANAPATSAPNAPAAGAASAPAAVPAG